MREAPLHVLLPARDEVETVAAVVASIREALPDACVVVIDDGSQDGTAAAARSAGSEVLRLPTRLGVGGAVRAGVLLARRRGARTCLRLDADGQHAARDAPALLAAVAAGADVAIGSRFLADGGDRSTPLRRAGILWISLLLRWRGAGHIADPTSGFRAYSRRAMDWIARYYPEDSPEPQVLAPMLRDGLTVREVPVRMSARAGGRTKMRGLGALVYVVKVTVAILLGSVR